MKWQLKMSISKTRFFSKQIKVVFSMVRMNFIDDILIFNRINECVCMFMLIPLFRIGFRCFHFLSVSMSFHRTKGLFSCKFGTNSFQVS